MPEPILMPATPPQITPAQITPPSNGATEEPFGVHMEREFAKAFHEAHPDQYPKPEEIKTPAQREIKPASTDKPETAKPGGETEIKPPAKAAQWKEVNDERARLKKENEEFKAQQEKFKTWETERSDYDTVKKRNDELTKVIQEVALERLPQFKQYFDELRNTALAVGQRIVGEQHAPELKKIAQLPEGEFRDHLIKTLYDGLEDFQKSQLGTVLAKFSEINYERSSRLQKAPEELQAFHRHEEQTKIQKQHEFDQTFKNVVESWSSSENGIPLFQMKDGDEVHNSEVKGRLETARNIINLNLSADQLVKAALWSSSAPALLKDLLSTKEELKAVRAENEALKGGGPELKGGGVPPQAPDVPDDFGTAEGLAKRVTEAFASR
jgi:hypothetical protein